MPFLEEDTFNVIKNTREEWAEWRESSTPLFDAVHTVLEVVFILGWLFRYLAHFMGHAAYHQEHDGRAPDYDDDDFNFTALVWPILEPVNWRQEALMRGASAVLGLTILSFGINPTVSMTADPAMVQLRTIAAISQGGYLLFDPLFGIAQRIIEG